MDAAGSIDDVTIAAGDWPDSINLDAGRLLGTEVHAGGFCITPQKGALSGV